jgi:hypothetical protein
MTTEMFVGLLIEGAILAVPLIVIAFLLSRFTKDIVGRSLLAIFLFAAAGAYFGFALLVAPGPIWTLAELVQIIVFGAMALLGLRGCPWWLVAGWTLHPLWDVVLHYLGPGHSFALIIALITYTIACLSFDLLVAAYIAIAYGLLGGRRGGFREVTS